MGLDHRQGRSLSFETEAFDRPQSWVVPHRGLEYEGEVIVAEAVNPEWGRPLEGGLGFRIVLFTVPRRIPAGQIQDPRIAMAVPRRSLTDVWQTLGTELRSIREARAGYTSARSPETQGLRRSMEEREASLRGELARRHGASYSEGRIYTHGDRVRSRDVFGEDAPESWADRLVSTVLTLAYPSLPLDHTDFPDVLTTDRISALYRGLFQADRGAADLAGAFAPGLGLSRREAPGVFDAAGCRVLEIAQRELESRGGEIAVQETLQVLAHSYGLPRPLAALYVMACVRDTDAEVELVPGHRVEMPGGGRIPGDRITWDLVPVVSFTGSLADDLGTLRLQPSLTWNAVLPYATLVADGLGSSSDAAAVADQERTLLEALAGRGSELAHTADGMRSLEAGLGRGPAIGAEVLEKLQGLCAVTGYREFHSMARESYQSPPGLGEALGLSDRLGQLAALAPQIARTKKYLDRMSFGHEHQAPQVGALARFNEIPELGEPVGTEVSGLFEDLNRSLRTCAVDEDALSLESVSCCAVCLLLLNEEVPDREAEELFGAVQRHMREYGNRLNSHSVREILAHPTKDQVDKFVNLLQVADPSALANVLYDEVVEFLRQFLRNG